jgi:hypothetical protein
VRPQGPARFPFAVSDESIELWKAPQAGEHERERHLGDGAAVGPGQVAHRDAATLGRFEVDGVDADADLLDQAQLRRSRDHRLGHRLEHVPQHLDLGQQAPEPGLVALRT